MFKNQNQSTKSKLLGAISIVLVLLCAVMTFMTSMLNTKLEEKKDDQLTLIQNAENFGNASDYLTDEVRSFAASGIQEHYDNYFYEVNTAMRRDISLATMKEIGLSSNELAMMESVSSISNGLIPLEEEAMVLTQQGDNDGAVALLYGEEYVNGVKEIKANLEKFNQMLEQRMAEEVKKAEGTVNILTAVTYISVVLTLLVQLYIVWFILKELIVPLQKIEHKMLEFAEGKLDGEFDLEENDTELGRTSRAIHGLERFQKDMMGDMEYLLSEMANGNFDIRTRIGDAAYVGVYKNLLASMRQMNRTLGHVLGEINSAAGQIEDGSNSVASGAQGLAQGSTEQASSVEDLAQTISYLNSQIQETTANVSVANQLTSVAGQGVQESNKRMQELMVAMKNIETAASEIGKIIKTIDDIAFQTNILALNAAVEAARAGTAGKGFAVVADEVRSLAGKSAEAANSTTLLIENAIDAIQKGTGIADITVEALQGVVKDFSAAAEKIQQIDHATDILSNEIGRIDTGVGQISDVIHSNSATAEESAAASEELFGQANMLKKLVLQFKFREEDRIY